jgi:hypothetical protein
MNSIKDKLLHFPLTRELLFFLFQKKVYKKTVDKKILKLLYGKIKQSDKKIDNLIVSLTSFPERISEIKYTIFSLLDQSILPEKIILWLAESQFPHKENDLPEGLFAFKKFGFDIRWCEDIMSYKKLIPALEKYPDYYVVTADDDLYYNRQWLRKLWDEHLLYPDDLICHRINKMVFDSDGKILPYRKWRYNIKSNKPSFDHYILSGAGCLFYKKYLSPDITNSSLFLTLAPYADDVWFYFMAILCHTSIRQARNPCNKVKYVNPYREYGLINQFKLTNINIHDDQNQAQIQRIMDYYNIDMFSLINGKQ